MWRGPTSDVASQGISTYDRREIAQKVNFPSCVTVGGAAYRYDGVRTGIRADGTWVFLVSGGTT